MSTKFIALRLTPEQYRLLRAALCDYVEQAFPEGCADCQQAARYALLQAVAEMEREWGGTGETVHINRRLRPLCKVAVSHYFDVSPARAATAQAHRAALLDLLSLHPRRV